MFTFAILAAVSTTTQAAPDKVSLEDQVKTARAFGKRHKGKESAGPYLLDGYSRTGYEGLAEASRAIPPLKTLLKDLDAKRFNVLILDNFDRLGDLAPMLRVRCRKHKCQIVSARQSSGILPPDQYDPYKDESTDISMHVEGIIQTYRINKLRRGWNIGVPSRVERGLHPLTIPFGYKKAGDGQPLEIIPEQAALLRKMKDWMLAGLTYTEIASRADQLLPPRRGSRWTRNVIKNILLNPFYAGLTVFGKQKARIKQPRSAWKVGVGLHKPLWNETVYNALLEEARRRLVGRRNYHARYPFTGLLVCSCGRKIHKHGKPPWEYLACPVKGHFSIRYDTAMPLLSEAIVKGLQALPEVDPPQDNQDYLLGEIKELRERRTRVQDGYEKGLYSPTEAARRLVTIENDINHAQTKIDRILRQKGVREEWQKRMGGLQGIIHKLPHAIQRGDPVRINQLLTALIEKIVFTSAEIKVVWRE